MEVFNAQEMKKLIYENYQNYQNRVNEECRIGDKEVQRIFKDIKEDIKVEARKGGEVVYDIVSRVLGM